MEVYAVPIPEEVSVSVNSSIKYTFLIVKDQYSHLEYPNTMHKNNKFVEVWTQLVIEVLQKNTKKNTPLVHKFEYFQMSSKRLQTV